MNIIKKLFLIMVPVIFVVGCTAPNISSDSNSLSKQAIQQNIMTKVQNDVNEIIGKDLNYVLTYMGNPYATVYSIKVDGLENLDLSNIDDLKISQNLQKIKNINDVKLLNTGLLYPKYTSDYRLEGSGLYIIVKDDLVSRVDTCDFNNFDETQVYSENADLIVFSYEKYDDVDLSTIDDKALNEYIGENEADILNVIKHKKCAYSVTLTKNDSLKVNIYHINDDKYLIVGLEEDKIICLEKCNSFDIQKLYEKIN